MQTTEPNDEAKNGSLKAAFRGKAQARAAMVIAFHAQKRHRISDLRLSTQCSCSRYTVRNVRRVMMRRGWVTVTQRRTFIRSSGKFCAYPQRLFATPELRAALRA